MPKIAAGDLPGLNCGLCGSRTCAELAERLATRPDLIERCLPRLKSRVASGQPDDRPRTPMCAVPSLKTAEMVAGNWRDTLGREFDFYLEHFPDDPGPREIILPHNPLLTREIDARPGDVLIGRPLGMSCGCPITHCGVAVEVDQRTGVIIWCVTGPLATRAQGYKDLGYYVAEGYEGLVAESRVELKIGMRHYFQPRMCMLQWRHSGLINFLNRGPAGLHVRLEGLWIG